jgi:hypothetical protein
MDTWICEECLTQNNDWYQCQCDNVNGGLED